MKKALIISVILNVAIITAFIVKRFYYSQPIASAPSWSTAWNSQKSDLFSAVPINAGDIVFVGDSHIERFLLNEYYPCSNIRNRGIGSNTTVQVINRLGEILNRKPAKVFIQAGINDLATGCSADSTFTNLTKIVGMVRVASATPYIISLFPTRGADGHLNEAIRQVNMRLAEYCIRKNVEFINLYPGLAVNGELDKDLTSDDTHLNSKGYGLWKKVMDGYIISP